MRARDYLSPRRLSAHVRGRFGAGKVRAAPVRPRAVIPPRGAVFPKAETPLSRQRRDDGEAPAGRLPDDRPSGRDTHGKQGLRISRGRPEQLALLNTLQALRAERTQLVSADELSLRELHLSIWSDDQPDLDTEVAQQRAYAPPSTPGAHER